MGSNQHGREIARLTSPIDATMLAKVLGEPTPGTTVEIHPTRPPTLSIHEPPLVLGIAAPADE